ncbi:MAG TPA: DUF6691 family protein [Polyangiales bacterium]
MTLRHASIAALCGALLAFALALGRLTRPDVIIGWVDVFGAWDPSMLIFFACGVPSYHLMLRWARKRASQQRGPLLCVPQTRAVDARLIVGASIFGVGWGLGGTCPGPAFTSLGAGVSWALPFVAAMMLGLFAGEPARWAALRGRLRPRATESVAETHATRVAERLSRIP